MNFALSSLSRRARALIAIGLSFSALAARSRADVVFAWNEALLHFSSHARGVFPPHLEARAYAMAHIAMHDAIESAARQTAEGETRLNAQRAAAVCAADGVLESVLPGGAAQFQALAARHLAAIPEGAAKTGGMAIGRAAAEATLLRREHDGWTELARLSPPAGPMPDAAAQPPAALLHGDDPPPSPWLQARPFIVKTARQFQAAEPRTVQHDGNVVVDEALLHSRLFNRVDRAAALETLEQFWSQRPVVAWNRIARQLASSRSLDLREQARMLAVLNVAVADAVVSALHWRYVIGTWRSTTVDLWHSLDGAEPMSVDVLARVDDGPRSEYLRRDTRQALIPPTPDYPSLTATVAGAAQASLANFLKSDEIGFALPLPEPDSPPGATKESDPRTFTSISAAAKECAFVASLDGRHCREACISGYALGAAVGGYAGKRLAAASR